MKHLVPIMSVMTILFSGHIGMAAQTWSCSDSNQSWGVKHTVELKEDTDGTYSLYVGKRVNSVLGSADSNIAPTLVDSYLKCVFSKENANVFKCSRSEYSNNYDSDATSIYTIDSSNTRIENEGKLAHTQVLTIFIYTNAKNPSSDKLSKIVGKNSLNLSVIGSDIQYCSLK